MIIGSTWLPLLLITAPPAFEPSAACAECHSGIYAEWSASMHAHSLDDPVFQAAYRDVTGAEDRRFCLSCHAPLTQHNRDYDFTQPVTREGVTCDFCHSVTAVGPESVSPKRYTLDPGKTKRGPFHPEELTEKGHANAYSELHKQAEFCGGCHEVIHSNGFHVMSTYTEWKDGPYPSQGVQCQNCHMPEDVRFPIVDPHVVPSTKTVTSHSVLGGHSRIRLENAADLSLLASRKGAEIEAIAYVTNSESGHALPTGVPARKIVLTARLLDAENRELDRRSMEYRRVLADVEGKEIPNDAINDMFLRSASVLSDNRIAPKETRRESLTLSAPAEGEAPARVEAELVYEFNPALANGSSMRFVMARQSVELPETGSGRVRAYLLGAFALLVALAVWLRLRLKPSSKEA